MEKKKDFAESLTDNNKKHDTTSINTQTDELDWDWNDYLEEILNYGIESWRGG